MSFALSIPIFIDALIHPEAFYSLRLALARSPLPQILPRVFFYDPVRHFFALPVVADPVIQNQEVTLALSFVLLLVLP